ncbi:DUF2312 domain-containing protein [Arenibaculum pallidiluteum]|uniref:DUF2312 domain-containing protein n=1 Tax=Arenibaculum pallidiluteum TaxID=2812559 RepID=UPI002E29FEB1|nr:DUF2312 domain-containing protein [Arenibaculum pallidiluteum]
MSGIGHNSGDVGGIAGDRLRSFVERIERLDEEIKGLQDDRRDIFAEAKGTGFDAKVLRRVLALRRRAKEDVQEEAELLRLYCAALGMDDIFP